MISLVLAMIWTRRGQALTLALLSLLAVASAVAAPAYLIAAERAIADGQIATAATRELTMAARRSYDSATGEAGTGALRFPEVGEVLLDVEGFDYYHAAEVPTVGIEEADTFPTRLVFRQEACAHLVILTGRCLSAEGDALIGERTAQRLGLTAGDRIELSAARQNGATQPITFVPDGAPKTLTVAGTYRPADPTAAYWGLHGYFLFGVDLGPGEPVFTNAATLSTMERTTTTMAVDGIAEPGVIGIDRIERLRAELIAVEQAIAELDEPLQFDSGIPALLDRIDQGRQAARLLVPVMAVPLVLLACFTIYLTVGYGAQGRQSELAVVALRGTRWWTRWWLATGESLAAVLAGALAGCLAGQLLVNAVTGLLFPGVGADPAFTSLRYAPFAALAALAAAILAQRRQLTSPVAGLLRRAPSRDRGLPGVSEVAVAVLAVVTGIQYALAGDPLEGLGLFAPALIILALALVSARALLPLVNRYAARALRRGRLGIALAGVQLSRRPGAGRLFALLVASAAVAGFATAAVDTAARGRAVTAHLGTGADRVLTVQPTTRQRLLTAVHKADPDGRFAMAVTSLPNSGSAGTPGIAVETGRLAAVAAWPDSAVTPHRLRELLHPVPPEGPAYGGSDITIEVTVTGGPLRLALSLASPTGLGDTVLELGTVRPGPQTYQRDVPICRDGCRVNGIRISGEGKTPDITGRLVIRGLGTATPAPLTDPTRWRATRDARLSAAPGGLQADVEVSPSVAEAVWIQPVNTPYPLPIAYAGEAPPAGLLPGLNVVDTPVTPVAVLPAVPGLGRRAVLADLEYVDRLAVQSREVQAPQVWLGATAPTDAVDRLEAAGLQIVAESTAATVRDRLDQQGPAVALWFHILAAVLAGLLGAGALALTVAVDRGRRTEDLAALRTQGLRPRPAGQATLWTYPVLVTIATAVGVLVAVGAWRLTGWALPLAGITPPDLPLPTWPRLTALLTAAGAVLLLQLVVAFLGGRDLRRRIEPR
ncbi:FtsX-like permease family protein [Actinoplanes sp. NPDC049802]|uniref:FtsX-like permease family protein n=1 Tax=Actinoplanes sp. NPDC049802 TaxID=3154742 RepID=UPI0033E0CE86